MRSLLNLLLLCLAMPVAFVAWRQASQTLGLATVPVSVVGTGSMYPSLYWSKSEGGPDDETESVIDERRTTPRMFRAFPGISLFGQTYLRRNINRGDLVAFSSSATAEILAKEGKDTNAGFIKRVIGLPGETVELRDGFVRVDNESLSEPYIYKPRSTWGESSLEDCKPIQIPGDKYLVLGDNRKASVDSRGELGLVSRLDINFILPSAFQSYYRSLWRDSSKDEALAGTPSLDKVEFYKLLNQVRAARKLAPVKEDILLTRSSRAFGQGVSLEQSLLESGYPNHQVYGLSVTGAFTAEELLNNLLAFARTSEEALDPVITDIGVADLSTNINGCPGEKVALLLGGYIPATYDSEVVESWRTLQKGLQDNLSFWQSGLQYDSVYQAKLTQLIAIETRRLALATEVLGIMDKHQWLTKALEARIEADEADIKEAEELVKHLVNN